MALVEHAAVRVQRTPNGVQVTRWIIDQPAPPAFVKIGGFTGNVDRWQIIDYHAAVVHPSRCRRDADRHRRAGGPPGRRHPDAQPQRHDAGDRDHDALFLGPGARLRAAQQGHDRARVPADQDRVPGGRVGVHRAAGTSGSIPTRRRSTSTPTPAASRPAASSTGSMPKSRPRWRREGHRGRIDTAVRSLHPCRLGGCSCRGLRCLARGKPILALA